MAIYHTKPITGTNITVAAFHSARPDDPSWDLLHSISPDDAAERDWIQRLRPQRCLISPVVAFNQSVRCVKPAAEFVTFDVELARQRRQERRQRQAEVAAKRRKARMVPTAAMKKAMDPKKLPKGDHWEGMDEDSGLNKVAGSRKKLLKKKKRHEEATAPKRKRRAGEEAMDPEIAAEHKKMLRESKGKRL